MSQSESCWSQLFFCCSVARVWITIFWNRLNTMCLPGDDPLSPYLVDFRPCLNLGFLHKYRNMHAQLSKKAEHHAAHWELWEKLVRKYFGVVGHLWTITIKEQHWTIRVKQKIFCHGECSQHRRRQGANPVKNLYQSFFFNAACSGALNEVIEPET